MSCVSVEYRYHHLQLLGVSLPSHLLTRQSKDQHSIEGCVKISIEYPIQEKEGEMSSLEILKIWINWKEIQREVKIRVTQATSADFLDGGNLASAMAKAQSAAKQYRELVREHGIRVTRRWETIC